MRRLWSAAFIGGLVLVGAGRPVPLYAQRPFEGTIAFQMTNAKGDKPDTMVQTTKGNKVRIEGMGKTHGAFIVDGDKHQMLMIEPEQKKYILMTEADMQQMHAMTAKLMQQYKKKPTAEDEDDPNLKLSKTGRTETVAGTRCEVWHGTRVDDDGKTKEGEACLAKGVGFMMFNTMMNNPMFQRDRQSRLLQAYRKLVGPNMGILKMVEIEGGKPRTAMEAIAINRSAVPAAAFEPPVGYTEIKMADQMAKMHQGLPNRTTPTPRTTPQ